MRVPSNDEFWSEKKRVREQKEEKEEMPLAPELSREADRRRRRRTAVAEAGAAAVKVLGRVLPLLQRTIPPSPSLLLAADLGLWTPN